MSDIVPPCDCIELIDGQFTYRCECYNRDDGERAAAWCVEANHKAAADYDRCTIEFLRKEAVEQAAEIERLRAALRFWCNAYRSGQHEPLVVAYESTVAKFPALEKEERT